MQVSENKFLFTSGLFLLSARCLRYQEKSKYARKNKFNYCERIGRSFKS